MTVEQELPISKKQQVKWDLDQPVDNGAPIVPEDQEFEKPPSAPTVDMNLPTS
jgi:hypothetical protein